MRGMQPSPGEPIVDTTSSMRTARRGGRSADVLPALQWAAGLPIAIIAPQPLQFPSISHLEEAIVLATRRYEHLERQDSDTTAWRLDGVRSFLRFLRANPEPGSMFLGGNVSVQQRVIDDWILALNTADPPKRRNTVRGYFRGARDGFRALARMTGMVCPFEGRRIPAGEQRKMERLHVDDIARLLSTVEHYPWRSPFVRARNLAVVAVMVLAGLRCSEVLGLGNGDIDFGRRRIVVRHGKGPHGGERREVPMLAELETILQSYTAARVARDDVALFPSERVRRRMTEKTIRRLFTTISASLGEKLTPHMLRRTFIDFMLRSRVPDQAVMAMVGHRDPRTFAHYADMRTEYLDPLVADVRVGYEGTVAQCYPNRSRLM
jgi:integrase